MNEFSSAVEKSRLTGFNGQTGKMPLDILGELFRRGVTLLRLGADCLQHDGVEVATQATRQLFGPSGAFFSRQLKGVDGSRSVIVRCFLVDPADRDARLLRRLVVTLPLELQSRIGTNPIRPMTGQ